MTREPNTAERTQKAALKNQLQGDLTRLLMLHPFTATLALHLDIVPVRDWRIGTAATDGRHIFFDTQFAQRLNADQRLFVLAHEVWHCAADHHGRRGHREAALWGLAADSEINSLLLRDGFRAPTLMVRFEEHDGASAEQIYAWLASRAQPSWSRESGPKRSFDVHEIAAPGGPIGQGGHGGQSHDADDPPQATDTMDLVEDPDLRCHPAGDPALQQAWRVHVAEARDKARRQGTESAGMRCLLDRLEAARVPWQQVLRQFVRRCTGNRRTWARPSRRHLWRHAFLPGLDGEALRMAVALDTSGSTDHALGRFLGELKSLLQEFSRVEITVIECDAAVQRVTFLDRWNAPAWIDRVLVEGLQGGGGTDFRPALAEAARHHPDALVFFTDGMGRAPERPPGFPVLWALSPPGATPPVSWGKVVELEETS